MNMPKQKGARKVAKEKALEFLRGVSSESVRHINGDLTDHRIKNLVFSGILEPEEDTIVALIKAHKEA
jgi:hypothetical protein